MPYIANRDPGVTLFHVADSGVHSTPQGSTANTGTPNTPVRRRVRLHDQPSGRLVREMWSDPVTGAYQFTGLRAGTYYVTAFDHTGQYNGEIATDVAVPAPGG
jgi:hypothetical protein